MLKINSKKNKLLVFLFIFMILINSMCLSSDQTVDTTSDNSSFVINNSTIIYDDLYIYDKDYTLTNKVLGNIFASVNKFSIDPSNNGGVVSGNLFVKANTINIKSFTIYSDEKDNNVKSDNNSSLIYGNVYAYCNDFTLESNSTINGDLYVYAKTVNLDTDAKIDGNIFISAKEINFNCQSTGSAYINSKEFNMGYDGFIYTDLHLKAKTANINGYIFRNSDISSDSFYSSDTFKNENDLKVNSDIISFSGQALGNASLKAKNINFNSDKTCIIKGNLEYSAKKEIKLDDTIVAGEITFTKYSNLSSFGRALLNKIIILFVFLVYILILNLLIKKLFSKFIYEFNDFTIKNVFKSLGIGLSLILLTPIVIFLLLISRICVILGIILLALFIILLLLSLPTLFILVIEEIKPLIHFKYKLLENDYILMTILVFAFLLLSIIPFIGAIIFILCLLLGFGMICPLVIKKR